MQTLASIELIWALFIIVTVVAQIVKGAKKVSSQAPGKTGEKEGETERGAPNDELRKFLEGLTGGPPAKPAAAPPPVPPPVHRAPPVQTRPRPVVQHPKRARIRVAPPPPPRVAPQPVVAAQTMVAAPRKTTGKLQKLLREELANTDATRKSIVLRELLGPPIGLRPLEWRV